MRTSTWIAVGALIVLAAVAALWWTSRAPAPAPAAGLAPKLAPAPVEAPAGAQLEAAAPVQPAAPEEARTEPAAEVGDPRAQKLDLRGGGVQGRVLHAAPLPEPELFDAPQLLQDCGLPVRCATGALRLDQDGAVADVLVEIPLGASERFGTGSDVDVPIDACNPAPRRSIVPFGATAVLRNVGAHPLKLAVKGAFEVELAPGGSKRYLPERIGSVHCTDAQQPWIDVELIVTDNRYVALTDEHGRFRIPDLPRGEYGVVLTHPKLGRRVELDVAIGADVERALEIVWDPRSKPAGR